jgi:hypothetical protein
MEMTVRIASLVCCLGLVAGARAAGAQPTSEATSAPATTQPAPSTPAAVRSDDATEKDELGRSTWWPAPPANAPQSASLQGSGKDGASPAASLLPFERGVLFLPYLGLSIPLGDKSESYTVGHNFGALIGIHLVPEFSFNAEINVDYMSPGPLATETQIDFALCPLLQARRAGHLWVLGLKLGRYSLTRSDAGEGSYAPSETTSYSTSGFVWGLILGGFVPVGPLALGGLTRLTFRNPSSNCPENSNDTLCNEGDRNGVNPAFATFNFSVAALF